MPYHNNIPAATDRINASQPSLLENFQEIQNALAINHVTFNVANVGKHEKVVFPNLGAAPANEPPVFLNTEIGLYNCINAITTIPEIYLRRNNAATGYPMTAKVCVAAANPSTGWTYLPSGIVMKWGKTQTALIGGSYSVTVDLSAIGPNYTVEPYAQLTLNTLAAGNPTLHYDFPIAQQLRIMSDNIVEVVSWLTIGIV